MPLLAAAFLTGRFFAFIGRYKSAMRWVEAVAGAVMIIFGALLFADKLMFVI